MLQFYLSLLDSEEDHELFTKMYTENLDYMRKIAYGILKSHEKAEDAVQEAFLRIIESFNKFHNISCPKTRSFCVNVCRNVSYNMYNKDKKFTEVEFDEAIEYNSDRNQVEDEILDKASVELFVEKLMSLSKIYRDVMYLYCFDNMSVKEIAYIMNIPAETVKKRIQRARSKLAELIEEGDVNDA